MPLSPVHYNYIGLRAFQTFAGQFIKASAAAEQLDIKHQFIPRSDFQLLIDATVMFFHRVDADKSEVGDLSNIVTVDIVIENPPLCRGKHLGFLCKATEHIFHTGRQCAGIYLPGIQLCQHLHT